MHYKIDKYIIKTENSAKSYLQPSKDTIEAIRNEGLMESCLDLGCGKLRYFPYLLTNSKKLTLVDSEIQLSRNQIIHGEFTNIYEYIKGFNNVESYSIEKFKVDKKYDFILISNVLSSIPSEKVRIDLLKKAKSSLNHNGKVLVINQYSNSFFKKNAMDNQYGDGFILKSKRGCSFYGIIDKASMHKLSLEAKMNIMKVNKKGQSYHFYLN